MRCRTCDYPLWRLAARACPECGTPVRPSEYRFRPGAVRFRCPHCDTAYYGTSSEGHLEPPDFACVGCGKDVSLDEMVLEPAEEVPEEETGLPPNPWLARHKTGVARAWFHTVIAVLGAPAEFMRSLPRQAPLGDAILFAVITSSLGVVLICLLGAVVIPLMLAIGWMSKGMWWVVLVQFVIIAANVLWGLLGMLAAGFCAHAILRLLRGAHGGLNCSLQAILYAMGGVSALSLVPCPCCGTIVPIWWCVAIAIMLREGHLTSGAKAATAAILATLAYLAVTILFGFLPAMLGVGGGNQFQFTHSFGRTFSEPSKVRLEFLFVRPESAPRFPLDLVTEGFLPAEEFLDLVAAGPPDAFTIGALSANDLRRRDVEKIRSEADRLAKLLPKGDAPFRIGRAVFYYRSARGAPADWLILVEPRRPAPGAHYRLIRGSGDERVGFHDFPGFFEAENRRLEALGRAPLMAPELVPELETGALP